MAFWVSLAVFVVGLVGGLAYAALRGFRMWRNLKRTSGVLTAETDRIARVADEITAQLDRASASGTRLGESGERLRGSVARLQVQRAALEEARAAISRTFWFLPGM
jgi:hypothetical protein